MRPVSSAAVLGPVLRVGLLAPTSSSTTSMGSALYAQYVPDQDDQPAYDQAVAAVTQLAG